MEKDLDSAIRTDGTLQRNGRNPQETDFDSEEAHDHGHESECCPQGHQHCHHDHECEHGHQDGLSCGCGHCDHDHGDEEENRSVMIGRLITSALLLIIGLFFPQTSVFRFLFSLASALTVGYDVLWEAARNIMHGEWLDEIFLMSVASVGAFILGEFTEGAMVFLLFQLGEFLQDLAVDRSRNSISELMDIRPDTAAVLRDGLTVFVKPEDVEIGETILVKPGERIPLDGTVMEGESFLDTVALTGESVPRAVHPGEEALSGCVNLQGVLKIQVNRVYHDSTVSRILELVEDASSHKSRADRFITRFARIYTPAVVCEAAVLFLIGSIATGNWGEWLRRSLTFLVISCPCALVISVPLSYFNGIGRASRQGILVKGSNILETLSRTSVVALDKTGTVTKGVFQVVAVHPRKMNGKELIQLAAEAERYSIHPIAGAIRESCPLGENVEIEDVREFAGQGVIARVNGRRVAVGNERLMAAEQVECPICEHKGTLVHVAVDGIYEGHLEIADVIRESAEEAVRRLKDMGIRRIVLLTGDRQHAAEQIGHAVGVDEVHAELKPEDKVNHIYRLQAKRDSGKEAVIFVGDGINDAPVLAAADAGVAMGGAGSDAAVEAADVVLIDDDPQKLVTAVALARRTQLIVKENIAFSIAIKMLVMLFGALGFVPLWLAVFSDVGVCLLAILNAMR